MFRIYNASNHKPFLRNDSERILKKDKKHTKEGNLTQKTVSLKLRCNINFETLTTATFNDDIFLQCKLFSDGQAENSAKGLGERRVIKGTLGFFSGSFFSHSLRSECPSNTLKLPLRHSNNHRKLTFSALKLGTFYFYFWQQ